MKKTLLAICFFVSALSIATAENTQPKFSIIPTTAVSILVPSNETGTVQYRVTNQTKVTRTLTIKPLQSISQEPGGAGACRSPFTLASKQSCLLTLLIQGSQLPLGGVHQGPVVCKTKGNGDNSVDQILCSQPAATNILNISGEGVVTALITISPKNLRLVVNGAAGTITVTNTSSTLTALNIMAHLAGTALDGKVTQDASNCATVGPLQSCVITFTPGSTAVAQTSFSISGTNTNSVKASIKISALIPYTAYITNEANNTVTECDVNSNTGLLSGCATTGSNFTLPTGVVIDSQAGFGFVVNAETPNQSSVTSCSINSSTGALTACSKTSIPGCFSAAGIAIDTSDTHLYIGCEIGGSQGGVAICQIGSGGSINNCQLTNPQSSFNQPGPITLQTNLGTTYAYVSNTGAGGVVECTVESDATLANCVGSSATSQTVFGIDIDSGSLFGSRFGYLTAVIPNTSTQTVQVCRMSGATMNQCIPYTGFSFTTPVGVTLDALDKFLYVADTGATKVWLCAIDTTNTTTKGNLTSCQDSGATLLSFPNSIALH